MVTLEIDSRTVTILKVLAVAAFGIHAYMSMSAVWPTQDATKVGGQLLGLMATGGGAMLGWWLIRREMTEKSNQG